MKNTRKAPNIQIMLALWSSLSASDVMSWAKTKLYPVIIATATKPATAKGSDLRNIRAPLDCGAVSTNILSSLIPH